MNFVFEIFIDFLFFCLVNAQKNCYQDNRNVYLLMLKSCYIQFGFSKKFVISLHCILLTILTDDQFHTDPSGCTATVVLRVGNKLYCVSLGSCLVLLIVQANAGDSRTVLGSKGIAKPLSADHKPSNEAEKARICAAGGFVDFGRVNGNLALSRAIGDFEFKNSNLEPEKQIVTALPDVVVHEITDDDEFVVLACDGIWDCKTSQQVIEFVRRGIVAGTSLEKIAENLMDNCIASDTETTGLGCDNMTVCIVALLQENDKSAWYKKIADRVAANDGPCAPPEYAENHGPGWRSGDNNKKVIVPPNFHQVKLNGSDGYDKDANENSKEDDSTNGSLAAGFRWKEHFFPHKAEEENSSSETDIVNSNKDVADDHKEAVSAAD